MPFGRVAEEQDAFILIVADDGLQLGVGGLDNAEGDRHAGIQQGHQRSRRGSELAHDPIALFGPAAFVEVQRSVHAERLVGGERLVGLPGAAQHSQRGGNVLRMRPGQPFDALDQNALCPRRDCRRHGLMKPFARLFRQLSRQLHLT